MKILMVANYVSFPSENGNCRFMYLLDLIDYKNNQVELITTSFYHNTKSKRSLNMQNQLYKTTLIEEPGYKKNISLKRFYSHHVLSKNLKRYLNNLTYKPDVIYCSVPSLDVAKETVRFAKRNNIRIIIDIQDLWPESFKMIFSVPIISDIVFFPMLKEENYIYSNADEIVAVSDTYVNRALSVNKNCDKGLCAYLGTDLESFDKYKEKYRIAYNDDVIRIVYIGTLGTSYDIKSVMDAMKLLNDRGINNIKLVVIGDGPLEEEFKTYAHKQSITCEFLGRIEYKKMVGLLCSCDIAVNPIVGKSVASIINKVGDYAAAGIPVINTQNSDEYRKLLEEYKAGVNCKNADVEDIANKLEILINDRVLRIRLGEGNRKLAIEKFNREATYKKIVSLIGGDII